MTEYLQSFMPILSSKMGHLGDELNGYVHILMLLLMVGWGIFFIYCLIRFSNKNNPKANYHGVTNHYSSYAEYGIVAFEVLILIGFAIPGYNALKYEDVIKLIIGCVDYIYEGEKNYPTSESTQEELKEFFENLAQEQFAKIRKFFETMPKLRHECKVKNPKTGVESKVTFSGLQDFFGLASPTTA